MEGEEEPDYMSEEFINNCVSADIRPGLINDRSKQRQHELDRKKKETDLNNKKLFVSTKVLESDRRSEGLEKPLGPDNKGFAMLQKMGFKPGSSLGSSKTGIIEPIAVTVKNDRTGLGREQVLREIQARKQRYQLKRREKSINVEEYRSALSKKYKEREVLSDLRKSEKACYRLDMENEVEEPDEEWFWPENCLPNPEVKEEEEPEESAETYVEYEPSEKLDMLTLYLRQTYWYCIWCGVQYVDNDDLIASCPGSTRDDH